MLSYSFHIKIHIILDCYGKLIVSTCLVFSLNAKRERKLLPHKSQMQWL